MAKEKIEHFDLLGAGSEPVVEFKLRGKPNKELIPIAKLYAYQQSPDPELYRELYVRHIKKLKEQNDIIQAPGGGSSELAIDVYLNASLTSTPHGQNILRLDQQAEPLNQSRIHNAVAIAPGFKPFQKKVGDATMDGMPPFKAFLKALKDKPKDFYPKRIVFPCAVGDNHITPIIMEIGKDGKVIVRHFDSMGNPGGAQYEEVKKNIEKAIKDEFGAEKVDYKRISVGKDVNNNCCSDWTACVIQESILRVGQLIPMDKLEEGIKDMIGSQDPREFIHSKHAKNFEATNKLLATLEGPQQKSSFDVNSREPGPSIPLTPNQITAIDSKFQAIGFVKTNIQESEVRMYSKGDKKVTISSHNVHGSPGEYSLEEYKGILTAARDAMPGKVLVISNNDPQQHQLLVKAAQALKHEDNSFEFKVKQPQVKSTLSPMPEKKAPTSSTSSQQTPPESLRVGR